VPLRIVPDLHRATHQIGLLLESLSDPSVNQAEAHILAHLASHADSTVAELHQTLAHKRSTLTSVLDRLTAAGFVTRDTSADDRRSVVVRPTTSGKRAARAVYRRLVALEKQALAGLPLRAVADALAVLTALEAAAADGRARKKTR
jgi:DNA-binding MarR family transcriptional regulator